jgi:hypothetical protein
MAEYQLTSTTTIIRTADHAYIPADPANRDYADYLKWIDAGGVPDPYVPTPPLPGPVDANDRIDAGISSAIDAAEAVRTAIHAIPNGFNAANFQRFLIEAKALSDAFVAMLEAQQGPSGP